MCSAAASASVATCTSESFEREFGNRLRLADAVAHWAAIKPDATAIVNVDRNRRVTWHEFHQAIQVIAANLLDLGFARGDFLAASLPFLTETVLLEYGCFQAGVVFVPLDPRLRPADVIRSLGMVRPKGFVSLGPTKAFDFRELVKALQPQCPYVGHWIQMSAAEDCLAGSLPFARLMKPPAQPPPVSQTKPDDGALVIFTTGSTGAPKPALLSHRGITAQNYCIATAFGFREDSRVLVNLPPFHVGGQAEELITALAMGGTAVLLEAYDAARSLEAIEKERVDLIGQIPAMFQLEWRHSEYRSRDLSSLRIAIYGGQEVSSQFLEQLGAMSPETGTGLGLTETSGFCTYTRPGASIAELSESLGFAAPMYPMSIRHPILGDGSAGKELPQGEIGQVCFRGPQTFLGYVNNPEATAQTVSTDGYLYTGDLGSVDHRGLRFAGRAKWVIKPAGHQVFPGDVERHLSQLTASVALCGVVGARHEVFSEAIVAFIEKHPDAEISEKQLRAHARELISYMRPMHYVLMEPGGMPLNATTKTDYLKLHDMAEDEVARLRAAGKWDR